MIKSSYAFLDGEVLLLDKPSGWSSFDVVKKVRNAVGIKKVGHAGTLDPLATGLLVVCTGKKTKEIESIQSQTKVYTGTLALGQTTASYDLETPPEPATPADTSHIDQGVLAKAAAGFVGEISQTPPVFSAVKVDGKRAYEYARKGRSVEVKPRLVVVHSFQVDLVAPGQVAFRVECSKGTYIRSLAHDLGQQLGVGAYLSSLRRTAIGSYTVEHAAEPVQLAEHIRVTSHADSH